MNVKKNILKMLSISMLISAFQPVFTMKNSSLSDDEVTSSKKQDRGIELFGNEYASAMKEIEENKEKSIDARDKILKNIKSQEKVKIKEKKENKEEATQVKKAKKSSWFGSFLPHFFTATTAVGSCIVAKHVINKYGSQSFSQMFNNAVNKVGQYTTDYFVKPALVATGWGAGAAAGAAGVFYLLKDKIASWYTGIIDAGDKKLEQVTDNVNCQLEGLVTDIKKQVKELVTDTKKQVKDLNKDIQNSIKETSKVVKESARGLVSSATKKVLKPITVPVEYFKGGAKAVADLFTGEKEFNDSTQSVQLTTEELENLGQTQGVFKEDIQSLIESNYFENSDIKKPPYKNDILNDDEQTEQVDLTKSFINLS